MTVFCPSFPRFFCSHAFNINLIQTAAKFNRVPSTKYNSTVHAPNNTLPVSFGQHFSLYLYWAVLGLALSFRHITFPSSDWLSRCRGHCDKQIKQLYHCIACFKMASKTDTEPSYKSKHLKGHSVPPC